MGLSCAGELGGTLRGDCRGGVRPREHPHSTCAHGLSPGVHVTETLCTCQPWMRHSLTSTGSPAMAGACTHTPTHTHTHTAAKSSRWSSLCTSTFKQSVCSHWPGYTQASPACPSH